MANNRTKNLRALIRQTRLMDRLERSFATDIRREKNKFIVAQASHYNRARQLSQDLLNDHKARLKQIFRKHHSRALRIFSGDVTRNAPSAKAFQTYEKKRDVFSTLLQEWVNEQGADKVKAVANTTYADLRKVLITAIASEDPAQKVVKSLLSVRGFSSFRAATIARTETHNAAMFASKRTAQIISTEADIQILKRWMPALDERTRFSHAAMKSHAAVDMDGKFRVGGEMLDRPGDPMGSPSNVINCRCVLVYEEKEG